MINNENVRTNHKELLQEQLKKMDLIQDKLLAIDRDKPQYDIIEALYIELGRALSGISDLKQLQDELERYKEETKEKQDELERYKEETKEKQDELERYKEENEHLLSILKYRDYENSNLRQDITNLANWLKQINKHFIVLISSRRWKLGNRLINLFNKLTLKKKKDVSPDRIMLQLSQFDAWVARSNNINGLDQQPEDLDSRGVMLTSFMNKLNKMMPILLNSNRMKVGNLLISIIGAPVGRGKKSIEATNIDKILIDYQNWRKKAALNNSSILDGWLTNLEKNYTSLIKSKRWKLGDALISVANLLRLRKRKLEILDSIEAVFSDYHACRYRR